MIKDTEYMFASARIRAAEGKLSPSERIDKLTGVADIHALCEAAAEVFGVKVTEKDSLDAILDAAMDNAVTIVRDAAPKPSVFDSLLYKYDCCNAKTAIKSKIRGTDSRGMYFGCGTAPAEKFEAAAKDADFSFLPEHMAQAAADALYEYEKSGDGRAIDLMLDRACYADMAESAEKSGVPLIIDNSRFSADSANLMTALRINKMNISPEAARTLFGRAFVPGGNVSDDAFISGGEVCDADALMAKLPNGKLRELCGEIAASQNITFAESERILENHRLSMFSSCRFKPFGAYVLAGFLIVRMAEVKNCRLIAAALSRGVTETGLREEVRGSYV